MTSSDNEWINLHRFWIHLLIMFALTSGVMRNDLFVYKIIIPTPDCWQKKNFDRNDHSLSFAVTRYLLLSFIVTLCSTRCHKLPFFVPLVAIRFHSMYHSLVLLSTILGKHLMIRRRHLHVHYKVMLWRNWKYSMKMWTPASANLTCDFIITGLHHGHNCCWMLRLFLLGGSCFTK